MASSTERSHRRASHPGLRRGETASGWLFTAPMLILLGLFLVVPVVMALWVSVSDWGGRGSPFSGDVSFVGLKNYAALLLGGGLAEADFGMSLKNNAWYVILVVPSQTALSLFLAVLVNRQILKGRGFFRTAFYFPSVTSSVAITVLFLFLFSTTGAVNAALGWLGLNGPNWLNDAVRDPALRRRRRPRRAHAEQLPRRLVLGLDRRPERRDVRVHHHGGLHHERHVHAAVPRRAAEHLAARCRRRR